MKTTGPNTTPAPPDVGRRTSESGPFNKVPMSVCARNITSRGVSYQCNPCSGWVQAECSGLLNAAQYQRSGDWACNPCSTPPPTYSPPPTPTPHTDQKRSTAQRKWELVTN